MPELWTLMRYALISDIHANLPALEAVLADVATRAVGATYHLGDLVGYAPWPNEVVAKLRAEDISGRHARLRSLPARRRRPGRRLIADA